MPLKPHPTDPDKLVYVPRQYDLPTKREWIGLTVREIEWCFHDANHDPIVAARNIEAISKEKNT